MNDWTKDRLEQMINDGVEESLTLDYKAAGALGKTDSKPAEITKDVSSFANAAGGTIIYGVAEHRDPAKRHLPERIDPVLRRDYSREWLEQTIHTIQPRIDGVVIHPVTVDDQAGTVCYVVEIPQSTTAHQARDYRYYRRHNFMAVPMEDYEVREAMNRRKHPRIRGSVHINRNPIGTTEPFRGVILVKLENIGQVMARFVMVDLRIPIDLNGPLEVDHPVHLEHGDDGWRFAVRLEPEVLGTPLFPGSSLDLRRAITTGLGPWKHRDGKPMQSSQAIRVQIFADEMPVISAVLSPAAVLADWAEIEGGTAPAA